MKRAFSSIVMCCVAAAGLMARDADNITFRDTKVERRGDTVSVGFTADVAHNAAPGGVTAAYVPVITDGEYKVSFPAIVVQGRRAAVNWERREWANGVRVRYKNGIYASNGQSVVYTASVPFQEWMYDSNLYVETAVSGCGDLLTGVFTLVERALPLPDSVDGPERIAPKRVGEILSANFPFVSPASEFEPGILPASRGGERDNTLTIFFRVNSQNIERNFSGNGHTLDKLTAAIEAIREITGSEVARVFVAGFSSPEGPKELNDRLAWNRALAVKKYIVANTGMSGDLVTLFNGSADWDYLRQLVANDPNVPSRDKVLHIIDDHPVWDEATRTGRESVLRNLDGGIPFRYLKKHMFPKLRNGTLIRIYFKD